LTQKYLDLSQQEELKLLLQEKDWRNKAAEFAKSTSIQIEKETKRLAAPAQLNLEQEDLNRRRERLNCASLVHKIPRLTT
jgi:hypothetical protein